MSDTLLTYCYPCRDERPHQVEYLAGDDLQRLTCVCGRESYKAGHVHWLYEGRATACGLDIGGMRDGFYVDRRFARLGAEVSCPDCALVMVEYLAPPTAPDWRPPEALGEDFYAA